MNAIVKQDGKKSETEVMVEINKLATTSAKVRALNAKGFSRGAISKMLNIRYQHVRNVLITPVKNPK